MSSYDDVVELQYGALGCDFVYQPLNLSHAFLPRAVEQ